MTNDYQNKQMQNAQAIFKAQCAARKEANRIEDAKTEAFKASIKEYCTDVEAQSNEYR